MDVLHPMLVTPVIQSMCFTDFFQANLPRLFPIPSSSALKQPSVSVVATAVGPTASTSTKKAHRRLRSVSTSDGAAIKIQAFVRGSLQRRSRRVDAQPGEWKAKHVARVAHQINAAANPAATTVATTKDKPVPARITPATLMQLRRHNPSPPPGPSPTSTPNMNSTPSPSPPPPLTASVNNSTLQPLPAPIVSNAFVPTSVTDPQNRPLRNSTGSLGLAAGALNAKAAPAANGSSLPLAQPLPIRSSSTSSLNNVSAPNSTVPASTSVSGSSNATLAPLVAQRSFSEGSSTGVSPHLSPSADPMLLITSRRNVPPSLDSTESLVSMMLSPQNGTNSNNSSGASSPLEMDFDRVAENVSVLSYSSNTLQPLCLISAESRLLTLRKQGGRNIPAGSMTVLQLLEEKKSLKKELTLARENHVLVAPGSGVGNGVKAAGAAAGNGKKPTTAAAAGGPRARSISPSLYRSNSTPPTSSTSAPSSTGMIQCDCCANAWQAGFDWKSLYQPLLLQYKLVNAALKNKGVQLSHSASDHSLGLAHHAAPIAHRPVSASGTSNSTLTIHQSSGSSPSPLLSSLVYGLQNPGAANNPAAAVISPTAQGGQPQRAASPLMNTSNNAAVVAAAAKRKQGSTSGAAGLSVGNSLNSNVNSNGVVNGTGSNSRSHSRSASPASHSGSGSAVPSPQFAAWTAQSQNAVQAAQLPNFKLPNGAAGAATGGASANASMVAGGSSNSQILQQASAIYGAGSQGNSAADWQRLKMLKQSISKRKNST